MAESAGEIFTQKRRKRLELSALFTEMELDRVLNDLEYFQSGSRSRLRTVRYRLEREIDKAAQEAADFYSKDLQEIYRQGLVNGGMPPTYKLTAADKGRVTTLGKNGKNKSESFAKRSRKEARKISRFRRGDAKRNAGRRGIVKADINGRNWNNGSYQAMLIRTDAQKTFNLGAIKGVEKNGGKGVEVSDGRDCGLTSHDDPFKVNGAKLSLRDAKRYVLGHPNCSRTFGPLEPKHKKPKPVNNLRQQFARANSLKDKGLIGVGLAKTSIETDLIGLSLELLTDAELRQGLFEFALRANDKFVGFSNRIRKLQERLNGPTEDDIITRMIDHLDELAEGVQAPEWVYEVLDARSTERVQTASGEFMDFHRVTFAAKATHMELNTINRIENHYGDFFQSRLAAAHPNAADGLIDLYRGVREHYNEPRYRFPGGTISVPRLGGEAFRGPRFRWSNRFVKVQTTVVNDYRHMTRDELRAAMARVGLIPKAVDANNLDGTLREMLRKEMIDSLGYNPGLLSHITINPNGLFRAGFRLSPRGFVLPDIRIVPDRVPLRYVARLNRGIDVDGTRLRSITQEVRVVLGPNNGINLPINGKIALPSVGISANTFIGRVQGFDDIKAHVARFTTKGSPVFELPLPQLRAQARFIAKSKGLAVENLDKGQLIDLLTEHGAGLTGREMLMRHTEFLGLFAEMRVMGFNRFQMAKIVRASPEQVTDFLRAAEEAFGEHFTERSLRFTMNRIADSSVQAFNQGFNYSVRAVSDSAKEQYASTQAFFDDFTGWIGTHGRRTFAGRVYGDAIEGYQFAKDFKRGSFGDDLIRKYGPKIDDPATKLAADFSDVYDETKRYDWKAVAERARLTPPQLANHMENLTKSLMSDVGVAMDKGSDLVTRIMGDQGVIRNFFSKATFDGTDYELGGLVFQPDKPGLKGKGFFLTPTANAASKIKLIEIKRSLTETVTGHYEGVLKKSEGLRDGLAETIPNLPPGAAERMGQVNEWLEIHITRIKGEVRRGSETLTQAIQTLALENGEEAKNFIARLNKEISRHDAYKHRSRDVVDDTPSSLLDNLLEEIPEDADPLDTQELRASGKKASRKSQQQAAERQIAENLEAQKAAYQESLTAKKSTTDLFASVDRGKGVGNDFDEVERVMSEFQSGRQGLGANKHRLNLTRENGDAEGWFMPQAENDSVMAIYNGNRATDLENAFTYSHEYGHYQDLDYAADWFVSDFGAKLSQYHIEPRKIYLDDLREWDVGYKNADMFRGIDGTIKTFDEMIDEVPLGEVFMPYGNRFAVITPELKAQAKFHNAVRNSSEAYSHLQILVDPYGNPSYKQWVSYLMDPVEYWARAYSQRISMLPGLEEMNKEITSGRYAKMQWTLDGEFERDLLPYIDAVLRARGVL